MTKTKRWWELTEDEESKLSEEDHLKYKSAVSYITKRWLYGNWGWDEGIKMLKELGWTERVRAEGHRRFIAMIKPQKLGGQK